MHPSRVQSFTDCDEHGPDSGAELFVVEGESAAKAVVRVRDARYQAVLAMQGKPLNAWKASQVAVNNNSLFQDLIAAIGAGWHHSLQLSELRFQRIIVLCDPDADGIHCSVLLLLFFYRWMRPLLDAGHLGAIRPPMYEIFLPATRQVAYAYSKQHYQRMRAALAEQGVDDYHQLRFRGLASMSERTLATTCVDPRSRKLDSLSSDDAVLAMASMAVTPLLSKPDNARDQSES